MSSGAFARLSGGLSGRLPNLEQYKKQAKELVKLHQSLLADSSESGQRNFVRLLKLIQQFHPKYRTRTTGEIRVVKFALSDAQAVIARQHGAASWPKFVRQIEAERGRAKEAANDPVVSFIRAACTSPGVSHGEGTLKEAEAILKAHSEVAESSIYTAAILGDAAGVRRFLHDSNDAAELALQRGGPLNWDALTYLCFSRYLRLTRKDAVRAKSFVDTARALLDAGAIADTGWFEENNEAVPFWESAIYGAAAVAQHAELTRLLLERGADPNDEETPYHAAEGYDHAVLKVLLESGKLNAYSLTTLLLRKGDWHDTQGMKLVLEAGADPNAATHWQRTPLQHTIVRDNAIDNIVLQLDYWPQVESETGKKPVPENVRHGESMTWIAARRGRGDVLRLLEERGIPVELIGVQRLIAACAKGDAMEVRILVEKEPELRRDLQARGGALLAEFAGNGNVDGMRLLLELGVAAAATNPMADGYFDIAWGGTALHTAAWKAHHGAVRLLLERGAPVNALDGKGRSALMLAVKACVDSYWKYRRSPESVAMLLEAGASLKGVPYPCGYAEVDALLRLFGAGGGS